MDFPTIAALTVLILVIGSLIALAIVNKKKGKTSCSCGCSNCAFADSCHTQKPKKEDSLEKENEQK